MTDREKENILAGDRLRKAIKVLTKPERIKREEKEEKKMRSGIRKKNF